MIIKKNKTIFTDFVNKNNLKFTYIDVGARGDIVSPWIELESNSLIVGFEPDSQETKRLNTIFTNRKYFDIALWSNETNRKVYINEWESTSSMYEPNYNFIQDFEPKHWKGRKPKFEIDVKCNTLDSILGVDNIIPDFIKIDTQGAELEILKGATELLTKYSPMVTCEVWCSEVYKDAPTMDKVIAFMNSVGYEVFDMEISAAWRYGTQSSQSKRRALGYEVLFVKINNINVNYKEQYLKLLLLLELYGYRNYALHLVKQNKDLHEIKTLLENNEKHENKLMQKIINQVIKAINKLIDFKYKVYPTIKY